MAEKSFLDVPGYPVGLRNNNPGNLRPLSNGVKWQGEIEKDYANNLSRFQNIFYGIRAMGTDITGDIAKHDLNTIRKLITAYAPPIENDTESYIQYVSNFTGIDSDQLIPLNSNVIGSIMKAQMNIELGEQFANLITNSDINKGLQMMSSATKELLQFKNSNAAIIGIAALAIALFSIHTIK